MEFKYRAIDNKSPLSSERSLRGAGGFWDMEKTFRGGESLWRELEKEKIRREIIGNEIWRRRELEEEVRRELVLGMSMQRCLGAPFFLYQESGCSNNPSAAAVSHSQPQIQEFKPSSPKIHNNKKIIILPKPDPVVYNGKRKAVALTPAVNVTETSALALKKKPKEEWRCALCQVSATSQSGLNNHLHGRKHRVKEAAMRTRKIGLDAKVYRQLPQPCLTLEELNRTIVDKAVMESKTEEEEEIVQKSQNIVGLENQNGKETEEAGKANASTQLKLLQIMAPVEITPDKDNVIMSAKPDPDFHIAKQKAVRPAANDTSASAFGLKKKSKEWKCSLCQVSATSESGLTNHLNGRKHKAKEAALATQKIGKSTEASLLSKESEKNVKVTKPIITITSGLDAKADKQMPEPCITLEELNQTMTDNRGVVKSKNEEQLVKKSENTCGLKNQDGTKTEEVRKTNALARRNVILWCEVCQVHTSSQVVMETHKKGKKHLRQMENFCHNHASVTPTSSGS